MRVVVDMFALFFQVWRGNTGTHESSGVVQAGVAEAGVARCVLFNVGSADFHIPAH